MELGVVVSDLGLLVPVLPPLVVLLSGHRLVEGAFSSLVVGQSIQMLDCLSSINVRFVM